MERDVRQLIRIKDLSLFEKFIKLCAGRIGNILQHSSDLIKHRRNEGLDPRLYYYRDHHGKEIDVIFCRGHELIPIEIKAAQTFDRSFLKNLNDFKKLSPERIPTGYLIYTGAEQQAIQAFNLLNYQQATKVFSDDT